MTTAPKLRWREVQISQIDIPREYVRKTPNEDADKRDAASVAASGIHQPLIVIPNGSRFTLVKGTRRIAMAEANDLKTVPVIVNFPPKGSSKAERKLYRDKLRDFLFKRQDLRPSEWVSVVREAQTTFKLNNKEMAVLLKVDPATLTNNYRIEHYAKPIVAAIDAGETTLHHAQAVWGMRPSAQVRVFSELKDEFRESSGHKLQSLVRKRFDPKKHPEMWQAPEKTAEHISKRGAKRRQLIKARSTPVSKKELDSLNDDLESLQTEYEDNKAMIERANRLLQLIAPIHRAVSNDDALMDCVAKKFPQHLPALERLSEIV